MSIINCTPHRVVLVVDEHTQRVFDPSQEPAPRVETTVLDDEPLDGIPVVVTVQGATTNLPPRRDGTFFIVSSIVLEANPGRHDLLAPDTGPGSAVRNADGQIVGVKRFRRNMLSTLANRQEKK